jgi:hypothetical protein
MRHPESGHQIRICRFTYTDLDPGSHFITDPTRSGTQPETDSRARKTCFSIHLHGLDTVLHLLQVGQIGLQQKLHLLQVI